MSRTCACWRARGCEKNLRCLAVEWHCEIGRPIRKVSEAYALSTVRRRSQNAPKAVSAAPNAKAQGALAGTGVATAAGAQACEALILMSSIPRSKPCRAGWLFGSITCSVSDEAGAVIVQLTCCQGRRVALLSVTFVKVGVVPATSVAPSINWARTIGALT